MSMFLAGLELALLVLLYLFLVWYLFLVVASLVTDRLPVRDAITYPARAAARWCLWRVNRVERWIQIRCATWLGVPALRAQTIKAFEVDAQKFRYWLEIHEHNDATRDDFTRQLLVQLEHVARTQKQAVGLLQDVNERLTFYERHTASLEYSYEKLQRERERLAQMRRQVEEARVAADASQEVEREQQRLLVVK